MPLIRSDRTDRRRRVMREAVAADAGVAAESVRAKQRRKMRDRDAENADLTKLKRDPGYSQAVRRACQQRLVQLIPVRRSSLILTIAGWWTLWATLMLAHYFVHIQPIGGINQLPVAYLAHMRSNHGIAHWLGGQLWMLTALASLMIFQLRKHKLDDYRAKYRVWGLLAIAALFSSLDASSSALYLLGMSIDGWARREIGYSGWALVLTTFATCVGLLGLRICSEIKAAPMSVTFWLGGLISWAMSALIGTELMTSPWDKLTTDMVVGGSWLGGILSVFLAGGIYLRHIYIEAQKRFILRNGLLAQRQAWKLPKFSRRDRSEIDPEDESEDAESDSEEDNGEQDSRPAKSWLPWKWSTPPDKLDQDEDVDEDEHEEPEIRLQQSRSKTRADREELKVEDRSDSKGRKESGQTMTTEKSAKRRWWRLPRWHSDPTLGEDFSDITAERRKRDDGFEEAFGKKQGWFAKNTASNPKQPSSTTSSQSWWKRSPKSQSATPNPAQKADVSKKGEITKTADQAKSTQSKGSWFRKSSQTPTADASAPVNKKTKRSWGLFKKPTTEEKSDSKTSITPKTAGDKPKRKLFQFLENLKLKPPADVKPKTTSNPGSAVRPGTLPNSSMQKGEPSQTQSNYNDSRSSSHSDDDDYDDDSNRSLSKAERKRLRRMQQENRRAA